MGNAIPLTREVTPSGSIRTRHATGQLHQARIIALLRTANDVTDTARRICAGRRGRGVAAGTSTLTPVEGNEEDEGQTTSGSTNGGLS
jgi:hypothetical protein